MLNVNVFAKVSLALGLVALVAGCGGKPSRMERALSEKDDYIRQQQTQLAEAQKREAEAQRREEELLRQKSAAMEANAGMSRNLKDSLERNGKAAMETQTRVMSLQEQIAALEKKLGSQNGGGDSVTIRSDENGAITIHVASSILFDLGRADLKTSAHSKLNQIAQTIKSDYPDNFLRIEGHTDSTPVVHNKDKFADNMVLSQARSKAVYDYLISRAGMPANKMYTAGYAYYQPVVWPEKTSADRARNRRVDIVILPNVKIAKESLASGK